MPQENIVPVAVSKKVQAAAYDCLDGRLRKMMGSIIPKDGGWVSKPVAGLKLGSPEWLVNHHVQAYSTKVAAVLFPHADCFAFGGNAELALAHALPYAEAFRNAGVPSICCFLGNGYGDIVANHAKGHCVEKHLVSALAGRLPKFDEGFCPREVWFARHFSQIPGAGVLRVSTDFLTRNNLETLGHVVEKFCGGGVKIVARFIETSDRHRQEIRRQLVRYGLPIVA